MAADQSALTVPIDEQWAGWLRTREQLHPDPMEISLFKLTNDKASSIVPITRDGTSSRQWTDWAGLPKSEYCRFICYLDLYTGALKILLWYPPSPWNSDLYYEGQRTMAQIATDGTVDIVYGKDGLGPLNQRLNMAAREQIRQGSRPVITTDLTGLLELQPSELGGEITSRRHRRFANLFWELQNDGNFSLRRCSQSEEFKADGTSAALNTTGNPAALLLADDVEVSGMLMLPDGAGFWMPDPSTSAALTATADFPATPPPPPTPLVRIQRDPGKGTRTDYSERGSDKINAHAQLTLSRPSQDATEWTVAIRIGADLWTWSWAGALFDFLGWQRGSSKLSAGAYIYRYSDWRNVLSTRMPSPIASVGGVADSPGGFSGEFTFEQKIKIESQQYFCVWWVAKGAVGNPKDTIAGQQLAGRSDAVTVNGEIQFGAGYT